MRINSRVGAEFLGTLILVASVVGSGAMAQSLTEDLGLQLLINSISTIFALGILIQIFSDVSGAHFNPVVTLIAFTKARIKSRKAFQYIVAQFLGGFSGALIANTMFGVSPINLSTHQRSGWRLWLSELIATSILIFLVEYVSKKKNGHLAPILIPAWIGSAYLFTVSTSFANPAVTLARGFTDTFSGIDLSSVPMFIAVQIIAAFVGAFLGRVFIDGK